MQEKDEKVGVVFLTPTRNHDSMSRRVERGVQKQMRRIRDKFGWNCRHELLDGFSHIPFARSYLLDLAMEKFPKAQFFIFWDDDQIVLGDDSGVERLVGFVSQGKADVCGTLVVSKFRGVQVQTLFSPKRRERIPLDFTGKSGPIEIFPGKDDETPEEREATGFGLICIRRGVIERIVEHYELESLYIKERAIKHVFFDLAVNVGDKRTLLGEDFAFCVKAATVGARVAIDPAVIVGHLGPYAYTALDIGQVVFGAPVAFPDGMDLLRDERGEDFLVVPPGGQIKRMDEKVG